MATRFYTRIVFAAVAVLAPTASTMNAGDGGESPNGIGASKPALSPQSTPLPVADGLSPQPLPRPPASGFLLENPRQYAGAPPFSALLGQDIYGEPPPHELDAVIERFAFQAPSFLDQALPMHVFRFRTDAGWRMKHPDRAEWFWPKNGVFTYFLGHPDAKGPGNAEMNVNAVDYSFYVEVLLADQISLFTNVPFRSVDPDINSNYNGLGDIGGGLKWAFIMQPNRVMSVQIAGQAPSGEGIRGLGTENWWLMPGLLWQEGLTNDLTFYAQVQDQIPITPRSDFTGNVLSCGAGISYLFELGPLRIMPLVEALGWTVLSGKQSFQLGKIEPLIQDAHGKTIINTYYGIRFGWGEHGSPGSILEMSDLYLGYGFCATPDQWFNDQWRIEYRLQF